MEVYEKSPIYSPLGSLGRAGLAWECLRRNLKYQSDYRRLVNKTEASEQIAERWGISFPGDPDLSADLADIFWDPRTCPLTVVFEAAPNDFPGALRIGNMPTLGTSRRGVWGEYLVVKGERHPVSVLLRPGVGAATPLAACIPMDDDYDTRCHAVGALLRAVSGLEPCGDAGELAIADRRRTILSLWAVDLQRAGLSLRAIAAEIFGKENVPSGGAWGTHRLCGYTFRLVYHGNDLIEGEEFRDLLRRRRRPRRPNPEAQ